MYSVRAEGPGLDSADELQRLGAVLLVHGQAGCAGLGVGLARPARIVRRHGGGSGAESQPDEGDTFWFTLA